MNRTYTYTRIGGNRYCMESGFLSLAWVLLFKHHCLHLSSLGIRRRQIPHILKALIRSRLPGHPGAKDTVILPAFGHVCLRVHHGYKLFDFLGRRAIKIFDNGLAAADADREIEAAAQASPLAFAPTLLDTGQNNRWYAETFIPAHTEKSTGYRNPWPFSGQP